MHLRTSSLTTLAFASLLAMAAGCDKSGDGPTGLTPDTTAPTVSSTNPISGGTGVAVITASFNEAMKSSTISATTFSVTGPAAAVVNGTVSYDVTTRMARFIPTSALAANTIYTATISTGAQDASGNALAVNHTWSFTTSAAASNPSAPALGGAAGFVVLGGSTVTSTGATALTGDLGVSPGSAVTGFPPATLTGTMHVSNPTSAQGMADLTVAYNDVAGRTLAPVTVAGNIGGLTLPPGLYKSTSSLALSSGELTLDAGGNANAVFMFQIASSLTVTSGRSVILIGGAKSANVFWQVGSSATLGTTSVFKGTIMANQSISMATGAALNGRALARIGGVTLAGNSVVMPTP